jgi:hypothetical protein
MAETVEERCKLQFSFHIAALVIILNLAKAIIMCLAVLGVRETPFDDYWRRDIVLLAATRYIHGGVYLLSKKELRTGPQNWTSKPRMFSSFPQRWSGAASGKRLGRLVWTCQYAF